MEEKLLQKPGIFLLWKKNWRSEGVGVEIIVGVW